MLDVAHIVASQLQARTQFQGVDNTQLGELIGFSVFSVKPRFLRRPNLIAFWVCMAFS